MTVHLNDLVALRPRDLASLARQGHPIAPHALDDTAYHGLSLAQPGFVYRLTWRKFIKTFHRDPSASVLRGWNVAVDDNPLDAPWIPRLRDGRPVCYGHYEVVPATGHRVARGLDQGLLIHYTNGPGGLDPSRALYDPLVAVEADSAELLLGYTYVRLGPLLVNTPTWFALKRGGPLDHIEPRRRP